MMIGTMGDCSLADAVVQSQRGLLRGFNASMAFQAVYQDATQVGPSIRFEALEQEYIFLSSVIICYILLDDITCVCYNIYLLFMKLCLFCGQAPGEKAISQGLGRLALQDYLHRGYVPSDQPSVLLHAAEQSASMTLGHLSRGSIG